MATALATPAATQRDRSPLEFWHLLNLDAPSVAALWTGFFAWQFHVPLSFRTGVTLALAVWLLYTVDRLADAWRGSVAQERHRFHKRHMRSLAAAALYVGPLLAVLTWHLASPVRTGWIVLALPLAAYLVAVHLAELPLAKEPLVAAFFAAAAAMPEVVSHRVQTAGLLHAMALFGVLCWLNCAALARWEGTLAQADVCTAWLGRKLPEALAVYALAAALFRVPQGVGIGLAGIAAAGCLLVLDRLRPRIQSTTLRALADAALLTPLLVWPVLAVFRAP